MMFLKKHLAASIVVIAALLFASVVVALCVVNMAKLRSDNISNIIGLKNNQAVHERTLENIIQEDSKYELLKACELNAQNNIKKMQKVSLPADLLANAVWTDDKSFSDKQTDSIYSRVSMHASFNYEGKNGYAYFKLGGLDAENNSYGIIEYDGKIIFTSVSASWYSSDYTVYDISNSLAYLACSLEKPENYYYSTDVIVNDKKLDNVSKTIRGEGNDFVANFLSSELPNTRDEKITKISSGLPSGIVLYASPAYGYYIITANGKRAYYSTQIDASVKNININNQSYSLGEYTQMQQGKCGTKSLNIASGDINDYTEVGFAGTKGKLYQYKDETESKNIYETIYYPDPATNEKISFEKYMSDAPYFIWIDQLGTPILYTKSKYAPAAECGKPVIYLYPEKDMNVSVKVQPTGGFKLTEPAYNNGWNVWATTKSELTNLSDGANYPYLFWEGKAYNYETPDHGFVLKRENVARDMAILLKRLGLNEKESADFIEFWQPKLETKPFVYITFVSQEVFDKMAPLTVSPQPDKIIRVFMDYEPLDQFVSVPPLKITTPERTGFTVVEWGGRLR